MAFQGFAIVAVTVGLASLFYYFLANTTSQEQGYGYGNSTGASDSHTGRYSNSYDSWDQNPNRDLPSQRQKRRSKKIHNKDSSCIICLQEILNQSKTLLCGHRYHKECIENWKLQGPMKICNTCPLCRTDISETSSEKSG